MVRIPFRLTETQQRMLRKLAAAGRGAGATVASERSSAAALGVWGHRSPQRGRAPHSGEEATEPGPDYRDGLFAHARSRHRWSRLRSAAGAVRDPEGTTDVAAEHDHYLGAVASPHDRRPPRP